MSKVIKNTNQSNTSSVPTIELWDTDRTPNSIIYHYTTPELPEDAPAHKEEVHEDELIQFIMDFHLCDHEDLAAHFLLDAFEDVKDRYWDDVLHPRLAASYQEAKTYISAYVTQLQSPLTRDNIKALINHIYKTFGIWVAANAIQSALDGRRAA